MATMEVGVKPLNGKAYGSIPHLPGSRMGPADHHCSEGQARICTERARDKHDSITVTEKLDGACVAVARINGEIVALGRKGYLASSAPFEFLRMFDVWVQPRRDRFLACLDDGERMVGEWLILAHGTRYTFPHEPFVVFDIMRGQDRLPYLALLDRTIKGEFVVPRLLNPSRSPMHIQEAVDRLEAAPHVHGARDPIEGAVWRVERKGRVDFLAKWVRPEKVDGCFLPEISGEQAVWNDWPGKEELLA